MFKNYLTIAIRNVFRFKGYSLINLAGLAIGLASCILILLFVRMENSFDGFHDNAPNIYRINKIVVNESGERTHTAEMPGNFAPALANDYSEVTNFVRLRPWWNPVLVSNGQQQFSIEHFVFTDSTFFDVFSFDLLQGDPQTVLSRPLSTVISESVARRFFGTDDPIGKTLYSINEMPLTVTGIVREAPYNSHMRFDMLVSWNTSEQGPYAAQFDWMNRWMTQAVYCYVTLADGVEPTDVAHFFPPFMEKNMTRWKAKYLPYLQPLRDIHLQSAHIQYQFNVRAGNNTYVYAFTVTALLLLVIACINFINLSTARASRRSREVGMRKVLGAGKGQLVGQFLGESLMFSLLAMIVAVVLAELIIPIFSQIVRRDLVFDPLSDPVLVILLIGGSVCVGLLAGVYPAFVLSGFRPLRTLKQQKHRGGWTTNTRRALVTVQFFCSAFLIVATLIVYRQIDLALTTDPGFEREQQLIVRIPAELREQKDVLRTELLRSPDILNVTFASGGPGQGTMGFDILPQGAPPEARRAVPTIGVDYDFLNTYQLRLSQGREFDKTRGEDSSAVIINQTLAREISWDNPLGKTIWLGTDQPEQLTVVGIVEDFAIGSIHHKINPLLLYITGHRFNRMTVRIAPGNVPEAIAFIDRTWQKFENKHPFEYTFLDDRFAEFYEAEIHLLQVLGFFAMLIIVVACLGLLGLVAFSAEQRTKEIGIRKVLGASLTQLISLLSMDFLKLVVLANLLAWPVVWLTMRNWLDNFAYRIDINPWIFLLAGAIGLGIAMLTVSWQAVRAARSDPVKALRYE